MRPPIGTYLLRNPSIRLYCVVFRYLASRRSGSTRRLGRFFSFLEKKKKMKAVTLKIKHFTENDTKERTIEPLGI